MRSRLESAGAISRLSFGSEGLELPDDRLLRVDLLELRVFQLFTAGEAHLEILDGADLLLKAANLLRVGVLRHLLGLVVVVIIVVVVVAVAAVVVTLVAVGRRLIPGVAGTLMGVTAAARAVGSGVAARVASVISAPLGASSFAVDAGRC